MERIGKNEYYMNIAVQVSLRSTCTRRKVGAVIVKDNRILGTGYNGAPKGIPNCCDDTSRCYRTIHNIPSGTKLDLCYAVHAEMNALFNAVNAGCDLANSEIYVTTFPCSNCAKQIIQAGISKIYFIDKYTNEFTLGMLKEAGIETISMNGDVYRTPNLEGAERHTSQDMDFIDPLIEKIYGEYTPGTEEFIKNRKKVLEEHKLYEKYDSEKVLVTYGFSDQWKNYELPVGYTEFGPNSVLKLKHKYGYNQNTDAFIKFNFLELIDYVLETSFVNRADAEYGGCITLDNEFIPKHFIVAGLLYNETDDKYYILKATNGRLKGKLTMIQGHLNDDVSVGYIGSESDTNITTDYFDTSMIRELSEEVKMILDGGKKGIVCTLKKIGMFNLNDNLITQEHIGIVYTINISHRKNIIKIESGEPNKHEVVAMTKEELKDEHNIAKMDTWLQTIARNL